MKTQKEQIQSTLRQGECEIVFTKKDGSERQMVCTLHPDYLPVRDETAPAGKNNENEHTVTVWDIEAGGWRMFRIDSLVSGPEVVG